jgi:ligand-binding SRPBCC domain-containing protein
MARIELVTEIEATPERCFDLSRDIDIHLRAMAKSGERVVGGKTAGLMGLGEEVTWQARYFGVTHRHTSRITVFDRPRHFRDSMSAGRFKRFAHDHYFEPNGTGRTLMKDIVEFDSPFGYLGWLVDRFFLADYLGDLIAKRNGFIKAVAEGRETLPWPI